MKAFVAVLLVLGNVMAAYAGQPDDGIYRRAQGPPAPSKLTQDGETVFLGAKQRIQILKTRLQSENNENDRFSLQLTVPYDTQLGPSMYVLVVSGVAYKQYGSGSSQNVTSDMDFIISQEKNANQVANYLGSSIEWRRHPGHNLRVSFTPAKPEFTLDAEVTATLRITNMGTNTIAFMQGGRNRAARDNQYVFSASLVGQPVPDIGSAIHFGGLASKKVLKPGETFSDQISLSKWFAFGAPGTYSIHGAYYLDFQEPGTNSWMTVWEDYASADFFVTIKRAPEGDRPLFFYDGPLILSNSTSAGSVTNRAGASDRIKLVP